MVTASYFLCLNVLFVKTYQNLLFRHFFGFVIHFQCQPKKTIDPDSSIYLRAERSGTENGRVYTITYQGIDDSGNVAVQSATVTVPHDQD